MGVLRITMLVVVLRWIAETNGSSPGNCPEILSALFDMTSATCNLTLDDCSNRTSLTIAVQCQHVEEFSVDICRVSCEVTENDTTYMVLYNETQTDENIFYLLVKQNRTSLEMETNGSRPNSTEFFEVKKDVCSNSSSSSSSPTTTPTSTALNALVAIPVIAVAVAAAVAAAFLIDKKRKETKENNERRRDFLAQEIASRRNQSRENLVIANQENGLTENTIEDSILLTVEGNNQTEQEPGQETGQETRQETGQESEQETKEETKQESGKETGQGIGQETGQWTRQETGPETGQEYGHDTRQESGEETG